MSTHILLPVLVHATLLKLVWLCKSEKVDTNSNSLERAALMWVMQFESGKHEWIINPHILSLTIAGLR